MEVFPDRICFAVTKTHPQTRSPPLKRHMSDPVRPILKMAAGT